MRTTNWPNERGIHSQPSAIVNPQNPTSTEIVDFFLSRKFGEVNSRTRYDMRPLLAIILKVLVDKHRNQQLGIDSFNSQLFAALQNA